MHTNMLTAVLTADNWAYAETSSNENNPYNNILKFGIPYAEHPVKRTAHLAMCKTQFPA